MEGTWFAAARCVDGEVQVAAPVKALPDPSERARVVLIDGSRPRVWVDWPPGEYRPEALDEYFVKHERRPDPVWSSPEHTLAVVVCTHERPTHLTACLEALSRLRGGYDDLIVVDNAPRSGQTRDLVAAAQARGLPVRRIVEKRRGLSRARNRALCETDCDLVAFTDDDAITDPDWARNLASGFRRSEDVAVVTGLVPPAELKTSAQAWFQQRLKWSRTIEPCVYRLDDKNQYWWPFPYSAGHFGTGANFAVNRKLAMDLGGFREYLGAGTRTKGGEDIEMFTRFILAGHELVFEPGAIVWHQHPSVDAELQKVLYGYGKGLSAASLNNLFQGDRREVLRQNISGLRSLIAERSADLGAGSPARLVVAELAGIICGPGALAVERVRSAFERP